MESQTECEGTTNNTIPNTLQQGSDKPRSDQPTNTKPIDFEQRTDHDVKPSSVFTLLDLHRITFTLDGVETLNAQDATNEQFNALAEVVSEVTNVEEWYLEERRDFINGLYAFCQANNYPFPFTIIDEEGTPTAPLSQNGEATRFLHDVERARPVIAHNPAITSQELALALGWESAVYAHTVQVYVNAQNSTEEETN